MLAMFGMNVASGIRMMAKTDFSKNENLIVVGLSVGLGLGVTVAPKIFDSFPEGARLILEKGIVMGSLTAIVLNLFLNGTKGIQETQKEEEHDNGIVPEQVRA
ncbi:Uric acid permease PucJ [compost metagenome]